MIGSFEAFARIAVATLFNSLWEGALLALLVWAVLRALPNLNATTRYAAWCAALFGAVLLPLVTAVPKITTAHAAVATAAAAPASAAHNVSLSNAHSTTLSLKVSKAIQPPAKVPSTPRLWSLSPRLRVSERIAVAVFALWIVAALFLLLRLIFNLFKLESLKKNALPVGIDYRESLQRWNLAEKGRREVRLCSSEGVEVPVAVGLFDSMVLLPRHLLDTLTQSDIDQITLHELAHLRRGDDWTNGLQRIIQAIFFFNPAILFIAAQLDLEREVACDDWVLRQTGAVRPYATCLTKMAEVTAWPHRALAAPGVFVTRRGLSVRVERLLRSGRNVQTGIAFGPASGIAAALIAVFFVAQNVAPSFAFTNPHLDSAQQLSGAKTLPAKPIVKTQYVRELVHGQQVVKKITVTVTPPPVLFGSADQGRWEQVAQGATPATGATPKALHRARYIRTNEVNVRVPEVNVHVPAMNVRVPEVNVHVPPVNVHVPGYVVPVGYLGSLHHRTILSANMSCTGCDFHSVSWPGRDLSRVALIGSDFHDADLHGANLSYSNLTGVDFHNANLRNVNFSYANLEGCDMRHAELAGAIFTGAHLSGCDINVSTLDPAQARNLLGSCEGCNFRGANLRNQDLRGVSVSGDDLRDADLRGADMRNASFSGVDFRNARLDGAKLDGATFSGCDLSGVDLRSVDLTHASFVGSKLSIMR